MLKAKERICGPKSAKYETSAGDTHARSLAITYFAGSFEAVILTFRLLHHRSLHEASHPCVLLHLFEDRIEAPHLFCHHYKKGTGRTDSLIATRSSPMVTLVSVRAEVIRAQRITS